LPTFLIYIIVTSYSILIKLRFKVNVLVRENTFSNLIGRKQIKMENIVAIIVAILGSGGLCSIITAIFSRRKYKAEASLIEIEAEEKRKSAEREYMDYIHNQFKEITETHRKEAEQSREQNRILSKRVNDLEATVNKLLTWIVVDNNKRVTWLENELRKRDPDIEFPSVTPPPIDIDFDTYVE
jgi:hypothetical protein